MMVVMLGRGVRVADSKCGDGRTDGGRFVV